MLSRPLNRPRGYREEERRRKKEEKRERFYRKEKRGSKMREAVIIIPPTPNSILAERMKKICSDEMKDSNIRVSIQERGGRRLGQALGITTPGARGRLHCDRFGCFPCNSGREGVCRKTGAGYEIICNLCNENNIISKYGGESGRNLFKRGEEHVKDVEKRSPDKALWKHIVEKHNGRMEAPIFAHFKMEPTQFFSKPQRRKANEGVRIAHLDPNTRMNSRDEFRQGTNIMMQAVRGVGEM